MIGSRLDTVLVKLCAVIIVVLSLQGLTSYAAYFVTGEDAWKLTLLAFFFVFAIPFGIATLLWYFPATVVGISSPNTEDHRDHPVQPTDLILVGVTLVGLYALVFGVIDLFHYEAVRVAEAAYLGVEVDGTYEPSPDTVAGRYTNVLQIFLGISLLLGRKGIASVLSRVRGRPTSNS
jgi:hypothetical protein